ncbi:endopeptidase La [Entomomonas asaccharolytica]|uniref:Lon protease n=1 Tax=Entomomonas asaccharolytica TaxID=2785331 RepID=A0A974NHE3_9GAMM|nr:endopeptidase La [Entomomonas asaccharolytica]QQP86618.1 endopeptidase La [Entomomonas asaccharolytica]
MNITPDVPLLPLRDVVVYPHMIIPLFVGREKSIEALEIAMQGDRKILLLAQKNPSDDEPSEKGLYTIGTYATILQMLRLPDGTVKLLVEGEKRASVESIDLKSDYCKAAISLIDEQVLEGEKVEVLNRTLISQFEHYVQLGKKVPSEVLSSLNDITDTGRLVDTIAVHMSLKIEQKQEILEIIDLADRVDHVLSQLDTEMELLQLEKRIRARVKKQMERSQREYYLNEQMKAIQKELGTSEDGTNEIDELSQRIEKAGMTKEALEKAQVELNKLRQMSPMSAEATVVRSYLDALINVPWKVKSKVRLDLPKAEQILEEDHYGLEEVKERILEYLAVQKRVKKLKGPILCLVGPPGVGKTSLAGSIARATNRKFVRMALGGVRDEAEIRGHRRTYIGSMPGRIIQKMTKVGVRNPLFLLDEVDKMSSDMRGDPASALLEVLDPEQNHNFNDHYLEVDYDLSDVMFVCTSNSMNIPPALLDRMEIIRLPGYTEDEKVNIAQRYLVPKQLEANGLKDKEVSFLESALRDIIRYYTREAGVRDLERQIAKVCRKIVKKNVAKSKVTLIKVKPVSLEELLGVRKYSYGKAEEQDQIGQVTGLAWTQVGGELLTIEAVVVDGKSQTIRTGSLGDVMLESITAALTVVRSRANTLGLASNFYEKKDIHIHIPEGATPKDGPSAGIGMCTALVSALTAIPVKADVAMTGEITLRGEVLAIGGLKEKLLAARRGGIKTVIIPQENMRDLKEIPKNILSDLQIKPVKWIDEVLQVALQYMPEPLEVVDGNVTTKDEKHDKADTKHVSTH